MVGSMMEGTFPTTRLISVLCICLFPVWSSSLEYVNFRSEPPDNMYIFDGKDALIYWIFTISENIFQHFKGVVYKVKNHTEWTVFAVDDNRTGMRSVKAPYNGRVSVEDTGKLKIVNCTSSDTATYKIVVQLSIFNDVERAFRLTVLDPPKITASPKWDTVVAAGKQLQLNCTASGFPVPIVVLTRENTTLAIAHGLASWTAYSVSAAEGGLYKCWAWNHEKTKADERIFKVHVKGSYLEKGQKSTEISILPTTQLLGGVPAKILSRPQNRTVRIGELFVLECNASGEPAPQIHWLKNGVEMRRTNSNSTLSLEIDAADLQSGGTYVCEAGNEFGTSRVAFVINIAADTAQGCDKKSNSCATCTAPIIIATVAAVIFLASGMAVYRRLPSSLMITFAKCKEKSIQEDGDESAATHDGQKVMAFVNRDSSEALQQL